MRQPLRVPLTNHHLKGGMDEHRHHVRPALELPPGAFATSIMQEVMKTEPLASGPGNGEPGDAEPRDSQ